MGQQLFASARSAGIPSELLAGIPAFSNEPSATSQGHAGWQHAHLPSHHEAWKKVLTANHLLKSIDGPGSE